MTEYTIIHNDKELVLHLENEELMGNYTETDGSDRVGNYIRAKFDVNDDATIKNILEIVMIQKYNDKGKNIVSLKTSYDDEKILFTAIGFDDNQKLSPIVSIYLLDNV